MGCACTLLGHDDVSEEGEPREIEVANETCPRCGRAFTEGDRILLGDQDVAYHYECFEGPRPLAREGVVR